MKRVVLPYFGNVDWVVIVAGADPLDVIRAKVWRSPEDEDVISGILNNYLIIIYYLLFFIYFKFNFGNFNLHWLQEFVLKLKYNFIFCF